MTWRPTAREQRYDQAQRAEIDALTDRAAASAHHALLAAQTTAPGPNPGAAEKTPD